MSKTNEEIIKEFEKEDFELGTTMDGDNISINYLKLKYFLLSSLNSARSDERMKALQVVLQAVKELRKKGMTYPTYEEIIEILLQDHDTEIKVA